jgi:uncharacterized protein YkwD
MLAKLAICAWAFYLGTGVNEAPVAAEGEKRPKIRLVAIERSILAATNAERERYGLEPLEADPELMKTAREHCAWMSTNGYFQHTQHPVAENIAMGQETTDHVMQSWMGSSGHRANILNGAFRRIGVAAYRTAGGAMFWCQQFQRQ